MFSLNKSQPRGDHVHMYKYPRGQNEDEGATLLSVCLVIGLEAMGTN